MLTTVTLQAPPPLSASSPPVDKLIRKPIHSFPWHQRKVQTPQSLGLCAGVFTQVLPPKRNETQGHSPFLCWSYSWTVLGAWPALPESLNMWIINFSLPSRCVCGIISLDSKRFGVEESPAYFCGVTTTPCISSWIGDQETSQSGAKIHKEPKLT